MVQKNDDYEQKRLTTVHIEDTSKDRGRDQQQGGSSSDDKKSNQDKQK